MPCKTPASADDEHLLDPAKIIYGEPGPRGAAGSNPLLRIEQNPICADRIGDIFQTLLSESGKADICFIYGVIERCAGDANSPGSAIACRRAAMFTPSP